MYRQIILLSIFLLFRKTNFFRGFHSVPSFRIGSSAELGMPRNECFLPRNKATVPSLFREIFSERNSVPNPTLVQMSNNWDWPELFPKVNVWEVAWQNSAIYEYIKINYEKNRTSRKVDWKRFEKSFRTFAFFREKFLWKCTKIHENNRKNWKIYKKNYRFKEKI